MKTFKELGTLPKVGDLMIRERNHGWDNLIYMITKIIGSTYHIHKTGCSMHVDHLRSYYSPLGQDTQ